jgi:hypothetical protein
MGGDALNARSILDLARREGVTIALDGSTIRLNARRKPSPEILAAIKWHKAEIITALLSGAGLCARPCRRPLPRRRYQLGMLFLLGLRPKLKLAIESHAGLVRRRNFATHA